MEPRNSLYRLFNEKGILLYVGITIQRGGRLEQHADTKPWWPLVARVDIQHDRRRKFVVAPDENYRLFYSITEHDELKAILNEFPVFNIAGVPWRTRQPSSRDMAKERLRNRAEIVGAVARLDDAGVYGRLEVLEQVQPGVFDRAQHIAVSAIQHGQTSLPLSRETLVAAEELYFGDALEHEAILDACEEFGGDPTDYPHVRYQRYPYGMERHPLKSSNPKHQRHIDKFNAALERIKHQEAADRKRIAVESGGLTPDPIPVQPAAEPGLTRGTP